jgi:hypothetical protein
VFFALIHPLEDVAFREELRRADKEPLFDEKSLGSFSATPIR